MSDIEPNMKDEIEEILRQTEIARDRIDEIAIEIDDLDVTQDATAAMQIAWESGIHRLSLPVKYGGVHTGGVLANLESLFTAVANISAADSNVGQMLTHQLLFQRLLFLNDHLPESTLKEISEQLTSRESRIVGTLTVRGNPVVMRAVEGGVVVNGTTLFNTESTGTGFLDAMGTLEGGGDADPVPYAAMTTLDAPGVKKHHDWYNMGQRATGSQTITYEDVFVPDGWHRPLMPFPSWYPGLAVLMQTSIMIGLGEGAYRAMLGYVRNLDRPSLRSFPSASEDVLMLRRIGENRARLWAGHSLWLDGLRNYESSDEAQLDDQTHANTLVARGMAAKGVVVEAVLQMTNDLFELTGARGTANKYRFDRFWRNARTFACHDPLDSKFVAVGGLELNHEMPSGVWIGA